jgi:CubicO group peptidase (beta-lactamase class C family)
LIVHAPIIASFAKKAKRPFEDRGRLASADELAVLLGGSVMRRSLLLCSLYFVSLATLGAPDEEALGKSQGYPRGNLRNYWEEPYRVGSFSAADRVFSKHCTVAASASPLALARAPAEPKFRYSSIGEELSLDDYLNRNPTMGLLIIKDGEILVERYQYDRTKDDRFLSNSMAKTIVSMAIGIALHEGKIASLDDTAAKYEKRLAGTAYGETTLRNLLRMSSGVKFVEDYSGRDDLARWFDFARQGGSIYASKQFNEREVPQGTRFSYSSSQTEVLNLALRAATGRTLCDWIAEKIWQPMGAERDAVWVAATFDGVEYGSFGFNATLRDYARFAMLLANNGRLRGKQIIPEDYVLDATRADRQPPGFRPGEAPRAGSWGYGYQTWIFPGERPRFALLGVYGQAIFVDPALKLALIQTSASNNPLDTNARGLWYGVVEHFGKW